MMRPHIKPLAIILLTAFVLTTCPAMRGYHLGGCDPWSLRPQLARTWVGTQWCKTASVQEEEEAQVGAP